jgi:5-oxoprolinase (ATP-hydrolysing)
VIGFDMGGTSTDVSHYAGEFERVFETQVAGVRMRAPMMSIHTVAAGGGSILHFDGAASRRPGQRRRQPRAGQLPARRPAGGHRLQRHAGQDPAAHFPQLFGADGKQPLDAAVVRQRFADMAEQIAAATGSARRSRWPKAS